MLVGYLRARPVRDARSTAAAFAPRHLFAAGFALNVGALALIVAAACPASYVWWSLYGLGATANILAFTVLNEGFPRADRPREHRRSTW